MARGDTVCENGIYVESSDVCYTYKIMTQVCLMLKFEKDVEANTYSWIYTGGCFEDEQPVWYVDAVPGQKDDFKDIQFEVRLDRRSFGDISEQNGYDMDDDTQDEFDDTYEVVNADGTITNTTERPQDKIRSER